MGGYDQLKRRTRADYPYFLEYRTRWSDNDMYQHMNNAIYNFLYDSVINSYLFEFCGLKPDSSPQYGMVVHSHNDYFASISFPACAELGLRVNKIGNSSVTYEIALFEKGVQQVKSVGAFIQVWVDRDTGRPSVNGISQHVRDGLQRIIADNNQSKL
ncbi:HotDog domain-containing protein [Sordaria brevicollis]|uniref:HotDog domain-containing protein n=1 Tax=Sordaria brevicollis TaxID=83679 RepID=A0AAE0UF89_SORBR|nr:HotDog domain-containing protein [Sordaria brevicollis]